jgi:hypothetical protein
MKKNKQAQIWGLDVLSALTIFFIGIMIFFIYSLNQPGESRETFELLSYDGKIITDNLMSPGYPENWEADNVVTLGITSNNKINETKLEKIYNMDYTQTKQLFNTIYDYYFFFDEKITSLDVEGIGKPGATKDNIEAKNLIKITRFTIYQNKTVPLYVYIWEE